MDIDYPPTQTYTLGAAAERERKRAASLDSDDDRREHETARNQADALAWAATQWGEDGEITLSAYTARTRGRIQDTLRTQVMGDPGADESTVWFVAGAIDDAPWIDETDLTDKAEATGQLPPALVDWLAAELEELNDLSEGN